MYLLDTNVVSELRHTDTPRMDPHVLAWAHTMNAAQLYISVITLMELEMGILLKTRKDPAQGKMLRKWLEERVLPTFDHRILPIDTAVAQRCAQLHVPNKSAERDALIAATALVHNMTVVTRNSQDFIATGVRLINPWPETTIQP